MDVTEIQITHLRQLYIYGEQAPTMAKHIYQLQSLVLVM